MNNCVYYQATLKKEDTWFLTATLRSFEHLCFDRCFQKEQSLFEFFIPEKLEHYFIELMEYYLKEGVVLNYQKMTNRLINDQEIV